MSADVVVEGPAPYTVTIGRGALDAALPALVGSAGTVAIVHPASLAHLADRIQAALRDAGVTATALPVPDGEAAKDSAVVVELWARLGELRLTRTDAVLGVGGGATTDAAGFVAATWLRGVRLGLVPTTLLGMVDAAVGGKTGINTAAGKNLVGAFHPPAGVVCDLELLDSLPAVELASGLAEVAKCGFIADARILELIDAGPQRHLEELVVRSVEVKARVVGADLRESGLRAVLNYGHTLAHALERVEGYRWRHGEAVSVGLVYAAALSRRVAGLAARDVDRHREILTGLGLPTAYRPEAWPELLESMRSDKKARGSRLRFVVLEAMGRPAVVDAPDDQQLADVYAEVCG
ncbi:MAG TPA: 3-dehydroquinate synthase [Mycobacteriales bacterium]|nr:3-dehydroquinate synthase [Mycobacteriales bacterium]